MHTADVVRKKNLDSLSFSRYVLRNAISASDNRIDFVTMQCNTIRDRPFAHRHVIVVSVRRNLYHRMSNCKAKLAIIVV